MGGSPWPAGLRLAGYVTCGRAALDIGLQAGGNQLARLILVLLGSALFTLAFHVLATRSEIHHRTMAVLFGAQLVLALAIMLAAGCFGAQLLMFVLAAELPLLLALPFAIGGTVALWMMTVVAILITGTGELGESVGEAIATSPAGFAFVAAFTYHALGESRLRFRATQLLAELNEANAQLRLYAQQVEELAVARERNRLAGDIHDTLGHDLTVINIQLETAKGASAAR